ncbi:DUF1918 domain-containing protein [Sphaerisporangium fuscum]|uniref:DUF1918 domain-containing protein n=1 Tax=Sphaerisporangium fuscum TaxID=2835868 RepID=UPI001BDCB94E|nr:DUF1918 domain-containing protein [Sphaerisporangium fuscum]
MKAEVGDRLIVEGVHLGVPRRVGIIMGVHHADGSPPYDVRWLDQERQCLVFPGPDAHIEHADREHHPA